MDYTPIGRVRPIHRGTHDPSAAYEALDVVRRADGLASYMAKQAVPAGETLADGEYWGLLSDAGVKAVADAACVPFEAGGSAAECHPVAGYPLEVRSGIEPVQGGSGDPSPDNVRPITGWTGAKLTRCGKNLLKNTASNYTTNGIAFTVNDDGTVTANGTSLARAQLRVGTVDLPAGSYIASVGFVSDVNKTGTAFASYSEGGVTKYVDMSGASERSFTLSKPTTVTYMIDIRSEGTTVSNVVFYPMIRPASISDGAYELFAGDAFAVDFGQTVYGGTLDWNTGVLTVDRVIKMITGNEEVIWKTNTGWNAGSWYCGTLLTGSENIAGSGTIADMICSHAPVMTPAAVASTEYCIGYGNGTNLYVNFGAAYNTDTSLKDYFAAQYAAGTPVQVVYKLAAPTTIQLTPQEIAALEGLNTLYSSTGDTAVAGRADMGWLTQSIMDRLAALESAAVNG